MKTDLLVDHLDLEVTRLKEYLTVYKNDKNRYKNISKDAAADFDDTIRAISKERNKCARN